MVYLLIVEIIKRIGEFNMKVRLIDEICTELDIYKKNQNSQNE